MKQVLHGKIVGITPKTLKVVLEKRKWHRLYPRSFLRSKKLLVHVPDEKKYSLGNFVDIIATKPISKKKRFIITDSKPKSGKKK